MLDKSMKVSKKRWLATLVVLAICNPYSKLELSEEPTTKDLKIETRACHATLLTIFTSTYCIFHQIRCTIVHRIGRAHVDEPKLQHCTNSRYSSGSLLRTCQFDSTIVRSLFVLQASAASRRARNPPKSKAKIKLGLPRARITFARSNLIQALKMRNSEW